MSWMYFWRLLPINLRPKRWSKKVETFLAVVKSGLASAEDLNEACADCDADRRAASALDKLCAHLTAKGVLTKWQCDKLRKGKWKGFFLDGYCILGHIGKDATTSTYLCKEVATGKRVAMAVTPINLSPQDGRIHSVVKELPHEATTSET